MLILDHLSLYRVCVKIKQQFRLLPTYGTISWYLIQVFLIGDYFSMQYLKCIACTHIVCVGATAVQVLLYHISCSWSHM